MADPEALIGQTISQRILEKLGGGGMVVVYKAEDTRLHRNVALQFPTEELESNPAALKRFENEALASSELTHRTICTTYEVEQR